MGGSGFYERVDLRGIERVKKTAPKNLPATTGYRRASLEWTVTSGELLYAMNSRDEWENKRKTLCGFLD